MPNKRDELWRKLEEKKRFIACTPRPLTESEKLFLRVMLRLRELRFGEADTVSLYPITNIRGIRHMIRKFKEQFDLV